MNPRRIAVKFFARGKVDVEPFISIFHHFIQKGSVPGLLVDVADYVHVPDGPGVILIGHEVDYGIDLTSGRAGLLTTRKRNEDEPLGALLRDTLYKAINTIAAVEDQSSVSIDLGELELQLIDRLAFPNEDAAFEEVRRIVEPVLADVFGAGTRLERARPGDSRRALSLAVTPVDAPSLEGLLEKLGGRFIPTGPTSSTASREWDIEAEELKKLRDDGADLVLLDVRDPNEYEICNLGGTLVPLGGLAGRLSEFDKSAHIVVHCHIGGRGAQAVETMRRAGFQNVWNVAGGIRAWIERIDSSLRDY